MQFDFNKLNGKIKECYKNRDEFARLIPLSINTLSKKLNSKVYFSAYEIYKIVDILEIKKEDISIYFFTPKVEKIQQN